MHSASPLPTSGIAHDVHFAPSIFGSALQHVAQQEAVRARHGNSRSQAMHHDGRTIRSASRPRKDNAFATGLTARIVRGVALMTMPSRIVPRMKKLAIAIALLILGTAPGFAQSTEFGVLFGGSRRFVDSGGNIDPAPPATRFEDDTFSFSNSSIDLYYSVPVDPDTYFKIRAGRINTPVAFDVTPANAAASDPRLRQDVDGEVTHIEGIVEYRFSEAFGSTGLYVGTGLYRAEAEGHDARTDYGFVGGLTADFPLSRRYGVIADAAYHWTRGDFRSRYVTVGAGLRFSF